LNRSTLESRTRAASSKTRETGCRGVVKALAEVVPRSERDAVLQTLAADRLGESRVRVHHQNAVMAILSVGVK